MQRIHHWPRLRIHWQRMIGSGTTRRFGSNIGWLLVGNLASLALGFAATAYLARTLGQAAFGNFSYAQTLALYAALGIDLGLNTFGARAIARGSFSRSMVLLNIGAAQIGAGVVVLVGFALALLSGVFGGSRQLHLLVLVSACWVLPFALNIEWFFLGNQQTAIVGAGRLLQQLTFLVLVLLLVHSPQDGVIAALARLGGGLVSGVCLLGQLPINPFRRARVELTKIGTLIGGARWFWWSALVLQVSRSSDILILQAFRPAFEVGQYSAGSRLTALATVAIGLINTVMFSMLAREQQVDQRGYRQLLTIYLLIAASIAGTALLVGVPAAGLIIELVYGPSYRDVVPIFRVLLVASAALALQGAIEQPLLARGHERTVFAITAVQAGLSLALNLVLVPRQGATGAAAVFLGCALFSLLALLLCYRRSLGQGS